VCWWALSCLAGRKHWSRGDARSAVLVRRAFTCASDAVALPLRLHFSSNTTICALSTSLPLTSGGFVFGNCQAQRLSFFHLHVGELPHSYYTQTLLGNKQDEAYCSQQGQNNTTQVSLFPSSPPAHALTLSRQVRAAATSARCDHISRQSPQWLDHHTLRT
jgi:hypothetical protein